MWKPHKSCRICSGALVEVFTFGHAMPLANDFKGEGEPREGYVPVEILFCERCCLAQTSAVVHPSRLYSAYPYITSKSQTMLAHFESLWNAIAEQGPCANVIEIGSNTGDFLAFAVVNKRAQSVCGIDPAENLSVAANHSGIYSVVSVFNEHSASVASCVVPKADVILARHVFAHVDDWHGFVRSLDAIANRDTLICIEVPYLRDTLERVELDQLYLEHLSYVSIKAMAALLENTSFQMQKVMRFPVHGGAVAIFIRRKDSGIEPDASVAEFLAAENITLKTWHRFAVEAYDRMNRLRITVRAFRDVGKKVVGYGASAKSTVWISACGFTSKDIAFICDNTPQKQGKFSPGTDIAIVPESELTREKADVAICWAWNFFDEIVKKNKAWVDGGGRFVNPHE